MKYKILMALLALMTFFLPASALDLVELPLPKSDLITLKWMFSVGAVDDPAGKEGLANLTAQLMFQGGTKELTKAQLNDLIYPIAPNSNLSVDKEAIVFTATVHRDHLDKFYTIAKGLVLEPRFDPSDFARVKKSILKAIVKDIPNNNDEELSKLILDTVLFAGHPYSHLAEGNETSVNGIQLDDVRDFYSKKFSRANLLVGLAGGYDEAFKKRVMDDVTKLPEGVKATRNLPKVPMPKGIQARIISKPDTFGTAVFMGYPLAIDRSNDEFAALMVANSYFGEHRKSYGKLYSAMRDKRSLNYGDYSYIEWYPQGHAVQLPLSGYPRSQNFFSIWIRPVQIASQFKGVEGLAEPELGNGLFAIRQSLREFSILVEKGLAPEDFERTRKFLLGYLKIFIQSPETRLGFLMDSQFYGRKDYINEMIKLLAKLQVEDVNRAIRKYFQAENMYVAIVTAPDEAEALAEALKTDGRAPIVYKPAVKAGLTPDILAEDADIDRYSLKVTKVEVIPSEGLFQK